MADSPLVVLDATVLSNFAVTTSVPFITDVFENVATPPTVRGELEAGCDAGYDALKSALASIEPAETEVQVEGSEYPIACRQPNWDSIDDSLDDLDAGETAALALVLSERGPLTEDQFTTRIFVTDDLDARQTAKNLDITVTGSIGILARGINQGEISMETADIWLQTWVEEAGYYAPVDNIEEILPDRPGEDASDT